MLNHTQENTCIVYIVYIIKCLRIYIKFFPMYTHIKMCIALIVKNTYPDRTIIFIYILGLKRLIK